MSPKSRPEYPLQAGSYLQHAPVVRARVGAVLPLKWKLWFLPCGPVDSPVLKQAGILASQGLVLGVAELGMLLPQEIFTPCSQTPVGSLLTCYLLSESFLNCSVHNSDHPPCSPPSLCPALFFFVELIRYFIMLCYIMSPFWY